jgi:hypothetical protein
MVTLGADKVTLGPPEQRQIAWTWLQGHLPPGEMRCNMTMPSRKFGHFMVNAQVPILVVLSRMVL